LVLITTRSTDLRTRRDVAKAWARTGSAQVIVPVGIVVVVVRLVVGDWGRGDAVALVGVVVLTGPVEWVIHLFVLHASPEAWTSRRLGTGSGHREHHLDPPELGWLLLPGVDAAVFLVTLSLFAATWSVLPTALIGGEVWPSYLSALVLTAAGLGHYEWTHLLVHSGYRPRSRYYARLARNHRRHHYRNERYWLGVTSNSGDRLMRTLPRSDDDVPRSDTARTLS
jgi:Fatty acid hydroxylase superfamily